jgi:nucleotide-binding universal stress UspA family protein
VNKDITEDRIDTRKDIEIKIEGHAEQMMQERIRLCKQAGARNQISFKMITGKRLVEEILDLSEKLSVDLIVMASSKVTSPIMGLGSTARKVIDHSKCPVLVINHEEQY